ncbi:hypothetical protein E2562_015992 [Oryza meyeriana var. granulata]|uniref:Uncharacterized protein n=1 Tax=Oryza meyeriana var. granulata TaxID=110450 RepID=A0A6G1EKU2_9ORYZ|nr:hypothetical protein E2562_015992 [Oryza meyeriana var. granulata]
MTSEMLNLCLRHSLAARLDHSCHGVVCIMMEFRKIGSTRTKHPGPPTSETSYLDRGASGETFKKPDTDQSEGKKSVQGEHIWSSCRPAAVGGYLVVLPLGCCGRLSGLSWQSLSPLPEPGGPGGDTPGTELPETGDETWA